MATFNSSVWDAASTGNLHELATAVASYPHLIDAPHPHQRGQTPMYIAAENGHVEIIEKLVELGSHAIDTPDVHGETPMFAATENRHVSTIETLVRLGSIAIDTPDNNGWTPMFLAAYNGNVSAIETLVRMGSTAIDTPDNHGRTPLHIAAKNGHAAAIETLVRLGSKAVDISDMYGSVPLSSAICYNHKGCVKILKILDAGAKCSSVFLNHISAKQMQLLNEPVNENESAELRSRVYFSQSLVERLLFELEVRCNRKKIY